MVFIRRPLLFRSARINIPDQNDPKQSTPRTKAHQNTAPAARRGFDVIRKVTMSAVREQHSYRKDAILMQSPVDWSACLVKVAHDRDRDAFRDLFMHFSPQIKAFASRLSVFDQGEQLAEELVQETMIKVWQKAGTFDPEKSSAITWIFTIARNTRIDILRKNSRHTAGRVTDDSEEPLDVDDIWIQNADEDVFNQLAKQRSSELLHESVKTLPPEQSFILRKVYIEDKSHAEIAEEMQLPLGTVKSRVRLALNKLRLTIDR